ncbi:MAG: tetratricopeptide repeat protein [Gemmatimonadaceae bacterium]|jgi:tetratricopeptide (TPR) repeat protein|nr:tetratricopeptide repeat protein [Gemmatimonadaceae bacterium]
MSDELLAPLRTRAAELARQLDNEGADATALKQRIYVLHRTVEEQALLLESLQDAVRGLVDGWKGRFRAVQASGADAPPSVDPAPQRGAPAETPVRPAAVVTRTGGMPAVATTPPGSAAVAGAGAPDDLVKAAQRVLRETPLLTVAIASPDVAMPAVAVAPSPVIAMAAVPADRPPAMVAEDPRRERLQLVRSTPMPGQPKVVDELNASTFVDRGWSRLAVGDYVAAEVALRKALELNPADAYASVLLAWAEVAQERSDEALARLTDVLAAHPTHALGHVVAGHAHLRDRRFDAARAHIAQAIALDTDRKALLYAWYYSGQLHLEAEAWDDAIAAFAKALEYGPNLVEARYETGHAHWGAGRHDEARAAWRGGAEANKFNPWSARCREMLAVLDAGGVPSRAG